MYECEQIMKKYRAHRKSNKYFIDVIVKEKFGTGLIKTWLFLRVTDLFISAAEAGPLDIIKLRKGDKLLNISPQLPANTPDTPYVLQVIDHNYWNPEIPEISRQ